MSAADSSPSSPANDHGNGHGEVGGNGTSPVPPSPSAPRFFSSFENAVDSKRRVQIPSSYRRSLGDAPFLLIPVPKLGGKTTALMGVTHQVFDDFSRVRDLDKMDFSDVRADSLRRQLIGKAVEVELDSAGRITIPEKLAKAAGINSMAILTGMKRWFEIWSPEHHAIAEEQDTSTKADAFSLF